MNLFRTALLLAALTALFLVCGYLIGGEGGMVLALIFAAAGNMLAYWNSGKMALSMHGAREVGRRDDAGLVDLVAGLAGRAGLPTPRVYIIETDQPNAFATGRDPAHAAVAVTRGLMQNMPREELAGVVAHELAHIQNRDTLIMTVAATIGGAISALGMIGFWFGGRRDGPLGGLGALLVMLLAPLAAAVVQMAVSRTREYAADRRGAEICGQPLWLASALERLEVMAGRVDNSRAEANPATAHLFIVNPLHNGGVDRLFSTHPATANRVAALRAMTMQGNRPSSPPGLGPRRSVSVDSTAPSPRRRGGRSRLPRTGGRTNGSSGPGGPWD